MKTRQLLSAVCLLALAFAGCATAEVTEAPAAAEGAPATAEPTTGGEVAPAAAPAAEPAPAATAPAPEAAPAPVEPAAQPSQPTAPQQPAVGVIVTHKVKDFAAWKPVFDGHQDARKAAGILGHGLMADVKNDKLVTL
jgi:hypothetical protein